MSGCFRRQSGSLAGCAATGAGQCRFLGIGISIGCASTFGLVICLSDGRRVLLVKRGSTGCERSWRSSEGPNMKPCITNGESAVIAFWVGAQKVWKGGQEALRHTESITITSYWRAQQEDTGMKPMWDIADHGGKHHDPVNGPPTDRVRCLEEVGRTLRGDELIQEAQTPEKISRAGTPRFLRPLAATDPLRSYRHFGGRSRP